MFSLSYRRSYATPPQSFSTSHFYAPKHPCRTTVSLTTLSRLQCSVFMALVLQFLHNNPVFVTMSSSLCLKHFSSMTQAHCIYLYCSLNLTFWLCLNRCTEDSPPCPRFCRRYFVIAAQCPCIPVSMTVSSKHRRRDICAPDPHLRPRGPGCTDSPLIPDLGLSRSHSAFPTPQF